MPYALPILNNTPSSVNYISQKEKKWMIPEVDNHNSCIVHGHSKVSAQFYSFNEFNNEKLHLVYPEIPPIFCPHIECSLRISRDSVLPVLNTIAVHHFFLC